MILRGLLAAGHAVPLDVGGDHKDAYCFILLVCTFVLLDFHIVILKTRHCRKTKEVK
jgi:hypothetical protein